MILGESDPRHYTLRLKGTVASFIHTLVVSFMATSFRIKSTVRGHHVFKDVWTPCINEQLQVHIEEGNAFDVHAVAVWKDGQAVGHLPGKSPQRAGTFFDEETAGYYVR